MVCWVTTSWKVVYLDEVPLIPGYRHGIDRITSLIDIQDIAKALLDLVINADRSVQAIPYARYPVWIIQAHVPKVARYGRMLSCCILQLWKCEFGLDPEGPLVRHLFLSVRDEEVGSTYASLIGVKRKEPTERLQRCCFA